MPPRSQFGVTNRAFGGGLADELLRLRARGDTYDAIARWLIADHAIEVSRETIRRWVRELETTAPVVPVKRGKGRAA